MKVQTNAAWQANRHSKAKVQVHYVGRGIAERRCLTQEPTTLHVGSGLKEYALLSRCIYEDVLP